MRIEHVITTSAPPHSVFAVFRDVRRWPDWDPNTEAAELYGPFQMGTRGRVKPTGGEAYPLVITRVEHDRCFTAESHLPMLDLRFEYQLEAMIGYTTIVHAVTLSGALVPIVGELLAGQLNHSLPHTLRGLKASAEHRHRRH